MSCGGASYSTSGNRYGTLNQDNCFVSNSVNNDGDLACYGLFDGHGLLGEHASRIAASTIELLLEGRAGPSPSLPALPVY